VIVLGSVGGGGGGDPVQSHVLIGPTGLPFMGLGLYAVSPLSPESFVSYYTGQPCESFKPDKRSPKDRDDNLMVTRADSPTGVRSDSVYW
jgi:hypothetical protein